MYVREINVDSLQVRGIFIDKDDKPRMQRLAAVISEFLKDAIAAHTADIMKSLSESDISIIDNVIRISLPDRFGYIDKGTRARFMTSLVGKKIPIEDRHGNIIIREVTGKAIASGKWLNPGIKAEHFVEDAINKAIDLFVRQENEQNRF